MSLYLFVLVHLAATYCCTEYRSCLDWPPERGPVRHYSGVWIANFHYPLERVDEHFKKNFAQSERLFLVHQNVTTLMIFQNAEIKEKVITILSLSIKKSRLTRATDGRLFTLEEYTTRMGARVWMVVKAIELPLYIQKNKSLLTVPINPAHCRPAPNYIDGTRFYTYGAFVLDCVTEFDVWFKIDMNTYFMKPFAFDLVADFMSRNAVFGHTGEFAEGDKSCSVGIHAAMRAYASTQTTSFCTEWDKTKVYDDSDWYYSNFVMGAVKFWSHPLVLRLGLYLNEYESGFFEHRWTDQIFFHKAMGVLLSLDENVHSPYIIDYSQFRCVYPEDAGCMSAGNLTTCANTSATFVHSHYMGAYQDSVLPVPGDIIYPIHLKPHVPSC